MEGRLLFMTPPSAWNRIVSGWLVGARGRSLDSLLSPPERMAAFEDYPASLDDQKWGAKQTSLFRRGIEGNGVDIVLIAIPHVPPVFH